MTPLRQRMLEDMQLRGLGPATQRSYLQAVQQFAQHFNMSPDHLTEEHLRQYFLYLRNDKRLARSTATGALCAIKFFYEHTLHRAWPTLAFIRPPKEHKLPVVLSADEVRRILGCVRLPHYRVCLTTIYAAGLRINEGVHLRVPQIDSSRMLSTSREAKGGKTATFPSRHSCSPSCVPTG
jgi:integrase/recombinase XerD